MSDDMILDMNDPFERVIANIVGTNRRKRADYAKDGDPFSNFYGTSSLMGLDGFGPVESAFFNVLQKVVRLQSLRLNGRTNDPANESVLDTYLDLAVYACIVYALACEANDVPDDKPPFKRAEYPHVETDDPLSNDSVVGALDASRASTADNVRVLHTVADEYRTASEPGS